MTIFDLSVFGAAGVLTALAVVGYRKNAYIIVLEFLLATLSNFILLELEWYKWTGSCWVFGARAIFLYMAMRATLQVKGHRMIYIIMLLGMAVNVGAYLEYATGQYWLFDAYYTPAARTIMILQLLYLMGIGYVGHCAGRVRVASVRWWRTYRVRPERRQITGGIQ